MSDEKFRTAEFKVDGALIAPQLAAIGAIASLFSEATVLVEKTESLP